MLVPIQLTLLRASAYLILYFGYECVDQLVEVGGIDQSFALVVRQLLIRHQSDQSILHALLFGTDFEYVAVAAIADDYDQNELDPRQVTPGLLIKFSDNRLQEFLDSLAFVTLKLQRHSGTQEGKLVENQLIDQLLIYLLLILLRLLRFFILSNFDLDFFDLNDIIFYTSSTPFWLILTADFFYVTLALLYVTPSEIEYLLPLLGKSALFHQGQELIKSFKALKPDLNWKV